jgi:hypothetical protein
MSEPGKDNKRRSSRVFARMHVRVAGRDSRGHRFTKQAETIVINAHGALFYLDADIDMGALLTLRSPATEEEQESRVVYIGGASDRGQRLGVEFVSPAPHFWGMEFPPSDWKPASASSAPD